MRRGGGGSIKESFELGLIHCLRMELPVEFKTFNYLSGKGRIHGME